MFWNNNYWKEHWDYLERKRSDKRADRNKVKALELAIKLHGKQGALPERIMDTADRFFYYLQTHQT